jgi:hypothetical protein
MNAYQVPPRHLFHQNPQGNWWFKSDALVGWLHSLPADQRQNALHRAQTWVARVNRNPAIRNFSEN